MPPHTPPRTPPARLRPVHKGKTQVRQCFAPLCALKIYFCLDIFSNDIPPTHTDTPAISSQQLVLEPKIARLTLLQRRHFNLSAQDTKQYHQFASVFYNPRAPILLITSRSVKQHYSSHPYRHPCEILSTTRSGT